MATSRSTPPAVILGGDSNALSAARTLARLGAEVVAVGGPASPVRYSRVLAGYADLGVGKGSQERWLTWLLQERVGGVLIPCSDDGVELIARNRAALEEAGYVGPESDDELALAMLDKERSLRIAHAAGVPAPKLAVPSELASVEAAIAEVGLPCVLKPRRQVIGMPAGFRAKAFRVDTREEFTRVVDGLAAHGIEVIASELVEGRDDRLVQYWSYLLPDGTLLLELTKRKVRQCPPALGTGCCQTIGWDDEIAEAGRRFVRGVGMVGYSSVEFKRRPSDGELMLIECNYRLIDSNEAGRVAGVDAAQLMYERALGRTVEPLPRPRDGVRFWHPVRDLRALREYRRRGDVSLREWAREARQRQVTPSWSWRDPRPSLMVGVDRLRGRVPLTRAAAPGVAGEAPV